MSLEKTAKQLDELAARRKMQTVPLIDFEAYMKAREEDKANVKLASEYQDEVIQRFFGTNELTGTPTPWAWLSDKLRFRPGEITMWTGFNGHMKSLVLGYVTLGVIRHGQKVCIASFEMKPAATLHRMARQCIGTNMPTESAIQDFYGFLDSRLWVYDQQGTVKPERIMGVVYYCAEVLKINHIVIDSLMKCVADEDDYNGQKRFVDQLCAAARDLNVHIHLVHHSRKRDNEQSRPGKQDAKGSGAIVDQTDNYITVFKTPEAFKEKDPEAPDFMLYCDKQRHGEWEGQFCLWFDEASLQFKARKNDRPMQWLR
jgi:twinkle protein